METLKLLFVIENGTNDAFQSHVSYELVWTQNWEWNSLHFMFMEREQVLSMSFSFLPFLLASTRSIILTSYTVRMCLGSCSHWQGLKERERRLLLIIYLLIYSPSKTQAIIIIVFWTAVQLVSIKNNNKVKMCYFI